MKTLTSAQLIAYLNEESAGFAEANGSFVFHSVCTDSRKVVPGCLFVPLAGANFDGHDFVYEALKQGAAGALSAKASVRGEGIIQVPDTLTALQRFAAAYKKDLSIPTVAITGSVGKTTTKEMTAAAVASGLKTHKTSGNYNNGLGLPLTLLAMEPDHEAAVVEMGMSARGEISALTKMARPDVGVITNIGTSHIEYLGSQEAIAEAKLEILDGMKPGSPIVLNGDDPFLQKRPETEGYRVIYYGIHSDSAVVKAREVKTTEEGLSFTVEYPGGSVQVRSCMFGEHIVYDALAALSVAWVLKLDMAAAAAGVSAVQPEGMRQRIVRKGDITWIMDCYNANPDSMRASLKVVAARTGRRVALLGDMLELGDFSKQAHGEIGSAAASCCDLLIAVGAFAPCVAEGAVSAGMAPAQIFTPVRAEAADLLVKCLQPGDTVLVKGSRGMKMEEITAAWETALQRK